MFVRFVKRFSPNFGAKFYVVSESVRFIHRSFNFFLVLSARIVVLGSLYQADNPKNITTYYRCCLE